MCKYRDIVRADGTDGTGAIHKLRNAVGVGGWSAKVLLLQSLVWYFINKMTVKALPWVGGWSKNSENCVT